MLQKQRLHKRRRTLAMTLPDILAMPQGRATIQLCLSALTLLSHHAMSWNGRHVMEIEGNLETHVLLMAVDRIEVQKDQQTAHPIGLAKGALTDRESF